MQSAYNVLGIPGNASPQEIEAAFENAKRVYTPEETAEDRHAADRFLEASAAYKLLRDPQARAAHDRKLLEHSRPGSAAHLASYRQVRGAQRPTTSPLKVIALIALVIAGVSGAYYYKRESQKEIARAEAAARLAAEEDARQRANDEKNRRDAAAAQQELALRQDAEKSVMRAHNAQMRQNMLDSQRFETQRREEDRLAAESRRRVAADRQRIRELCWLNYRKTDC